MRKIEEIVYETARNVINVEDKIKISTIFLFFYSLDELLFSELLYNNDNHTIITKVQDEYNVDLSLNFENKEILEAFNKTKEKIIEIFDEKKYYKSLYERDEYAIVCYEISKKMKNLTI